MKTSLTLCFLLAVALILPITGVTAPITGVTAPITGVTAPITGVTAAVAKATAASEQNRHQNVSLHGNITSNALIDALETVGIKVVIQDGSPIKLTVQSVHMGTAAYNGGLDAGDVIKHINQTPTRLILTIQRGQNTYQLALKSPDSMPDLHAASATTDLLQGLVRQTSLSAGATKGDAALAREKASSDVAQTPIPIIDVNQPDITVKPVTEPPPKQPIDKEKELVKYDLELIIDISGSMNEVDGTGDISKFEWCHRQVRALAEKMAPFGRTLTITTFNSSFNVMPHCDPGKVEQVYAQTRPNGYTDMVDPLMDRLEANLPTHNAEHPCLTAVITDGMPNVPRDPKAVDRGLIQITHEMSTPGQLMVTFLQIGDTFDGKDFCLNLSENLVHEGARFDIVDTKTFDQLKTEGLVNALIDAVIEHQKYAKMLTDQKHLAKFADRVHSAPSGQATEDLERTRADRKTIEREILGH